MVDGGSTDSSVAARLAAAREASDRLPGLRDEAARLRRAADAAQGAYEGKAMAHRRALAEVARCRLPAAHAWNALLRGRYRLELDAARAAVGPGEQASDRAHQEALDLRARLRTTQRSLDEVARVADELPALEAAHRRQELRNADDPASRAVLGRLEALESEAGGLRARLVELDEADHALRQALSHVGHALDRLGSAESWGTYDTFFGGGMISSAIKHDRIDDADRATRAVAESVQRARKELADVGIHPEGFQATVGSTARALDIWFDNIFTDIHVQGRIRDQARQLAVLRGRLQDAGRRVAADRTATTAGLESVLGRRAELVAAP